MASNRVPGVQVKEIDLSEVIVPTGTNVGALVGRTPKGPTNQRVLVGSNKTFVSEFGAPVKGNETEFPMYTALEFLKESDALWFSRPATYEDKVGNLVLTTEGGISWDNEHPKEEAPEGGLFSVDGYEDGNKPNKYYPGEMVDGDLVVTALGASKENSDIGIIVVTEANVETSSMEYTYGYTWAGKYPEKNAANEPVHYYRINVYVKQSNQTPAEAGWEGLNPLKNLVPVESWVVTNDNTAKDYSGNSMYVKDVVNGYSNYIYVNTNGKDIGETKIYPAEEYMVEESSVELPTTARKVGGEGPATIGVELSGAATDGTDVVYVKMEVTTESGTGELSVVDGRLELDGGFYVIDNWDVDVTSTESVKVMQKLYEAKEGDTITPNSVSDADGILTSSAGTVKAVDAEGAADVLTYKAAWLKVIGSNVNALGEGTYEMASANDGIVATWKALYSSKEQVTPNILMAPYVGTNEIDAGKVQAVCEIATSRRDVFAVVPASGWNMTKAQTIVSGLETKSYMRNSYCGIYAGADLVFDQYTNRNIYLPKVAFAGRILAHTANVANVWDAPAGTNRGAMNTLDQLKVFTEDEIGYMYANGINTSKRVRGSGDFMWGQKTGQVKASALDRINVRRLLLYIENTLEPQLAAYLFEANTETLRSRAKSNVDQFLETIYAGGGVYTWNTVCDSTNNTPYTIDNNELNIDLYVQPTKTVEFININIIVTRTGVSFTEA